MNEAGKILSALSKTCSLFRIDSVSFKVKYRVMLAEILEDPLTKDSILLLTVEQYHYLGEVGLIPEKTELLEGVIITKMPKSPVHRFIVIKLYKILSKLINENFVIQKKIRSLLFILNRSRIFPLFQQVPTNIKHLIRQVPNL